MGGRDVEGRDVGGRDVGRRDVVQGDILVWVVLLSGTVVMSVGQDLVAMVKSREGQSTIYTLI